MVNMVNVFHWTPVEKNISFRKVIEVDLQTPRPHRYPRLPNIQAMGNTGNSKKKINLIFAVVKMFSINQKGTPRALNGTIENKTENTAAK